MKKVLIIAALALALIAGFAPGVNLADPPPGGTRLYDDGL